MFKDSLISWIGIGWMAIGALVFAGVFDLRYVVAGLAVGLGAVLQTIDL